MICFLHKKELHEVTDTEGKYEGHYCIECVEQQDSNKKMLKRWVKVDDKNKHDNPVWVRRDNVDKALRNGFYVVPDNTLNEGEIKFFP